MRILVLGAGKQGRAVAFDLLRNPDVEQLGIADVDADALESLRAFLGDRRVSIHRLDALESESLRETLEPYDACLNAMSFAFGLEVTHAAIAARTHVCDLGGSRSLVAQQLELDTQAFENGVTVVPDCGLAPGLTTVLAAQGIRRLDETHSLHIRVGELPRRPTGPLQYALAYPVEALIERYSERAVVIRDGVRLSVEPLTEVESIEFPEPFGSLEAFHTGGGLSTLPSTFAGRVRNMDFKSIRYPGHCARMRPLFELGFFQSEMLRVGDVEIRPRELSARLLEKLLPDTPDVVLLRVTLLGTKYGGRRRLEFELIDASDRATGLSATMRCTGFTASFVLQQLASGKVSRRGVVPPETCVPGEDLIDQLRQRGLDLVLRQS
jgi:lysine 6-dehydrogenase